MLSILFFGHLKEILQTDSIQLPINQNESSINTVAELRKVLQLKGDVWNKYLPYGKALVAVNQEISSEDSAVKEGDEVAFFPPVTGG